MTDIPSLIERIDAQPPILRDRTLLSDIKAALSLAVSPLPGEIAGMASRLREVGQDFLLDVAAALERMASENTIMREAFAVEMSSAANREARIRELEAERDQFAEQAALRDQRDRDMQEIMRINNELLAERDAIKAKTIEECAAVLQRKIDEGRCEPRIVKVLESMLKHIRALNQPAGDGGKE